MPSTGDQPLNDITRLDSPSGPPAALPGPAEPDGRQADPSRRGIGLGALAVLCFAGFALAWASFMPLEGAIVAAGVAKPEFNSRPVQHREGGSVSRILVRDGDKVAAGQVLFELANEEMSAGAEVASVQRDAAALRRQRLEAEFRGDFRWVPRLDGAGDQSPSPAAIQIARAEADSFLLGVEAHERQRKFLAEQIREVEREVTALEAKVQADNSGAATVAATLAANTDLHRAGFVSAIALHTFQRQLDDYRSRREASMADLAQARQRLNDTARALSMLDVDRRRRAGADLAIAQSTLEDMAQRRVASAAIADRLKVRAPVAGTVFGTTVFSSGAVVAANQTLLSIVPDGEPIQIEARITPDSRPHVAVGQRVEMRPLIQGVTMPDVIAGVVRHVSSDRIVDERSGQPYFTIRVASEDDAGYKVRAGMTMDVFILTGPRSTFDYLRKPFSDAFRRALREP